MKKETDSRRQRDTAYRRVRQYPPREQGARLYAPPRLHVRLGLFHLHPNYRTNLTCPSRPTRAAGHSSFRQVVLLHWLPRV